MRPKTNLACCKITSVPYTSYNTGCHGAIHTFLDKPFQPINIEGYIELEWAKIKLHVGNHPKAQNGIQ